VGRLKWRIKKKKGLITVLSKREIKELIRREIEAEASALEQKVIDNPQLDSYTFPRK